MKKAKLPLGGYSVLLTVYNLFLGRLLWKNRLSQNASAFSLTDAALLGIATHKLSRIATKDIVTAPLRAPFTKFEDFLGYGEMQEGAAGKGLRQVIGEMVSCNYCADPWIALTLLYSLDRFPERTRVALRLFSAIALADFLHVGYETTRTRENVLTLRENRLEKQADSAA